MFSIDNKYFHVLIIIVISFLLIFRDADHASSIEIIPDSLEYVSMAVNLLEQGTVKIEFDGEFYPSRYTPWFSIVVLVPALLIFGFSAGNAIYGIFAFIVSGLVIIYFLFRRLLSPIAALAGALTFFLIPSFRLNSQLIMNDSPSAVICVIVFLIFITEREKVFANSWKATTVGSLIAIAYLWRITNLSLILPFCYLIFLNHHQLKTGKILFILPIIFALSINSLYSYLSFGSIFRNGYNYWTAIPYDYLDLTFNWSNFKPNLSLLLTQAWLLLFLIPLSFGIEYFHSRKESTSYLIFYLLGIFPILLFYLFYFCFDARFFLPIFLLSASGSIMILKYTSTLIHKCYLFVLLVSIILLSTNSPIRNLTPPYLANINLIKEHTPSNSIVITNHSHPYLNLFFKDRLRKFIAISRDFEYASKIISLKKNNNLAVEEIASSTSHRHPKLLATGIEPIKYVFIENPMKLADLVEKQNVYLDLNSVDRKVAQKFYNYIQQFYDLRFVAKGIYKLFLLPDTNKLPILSDP